MEDPSRCHEFSNGNILTLDATDSYFGFCGLTIYTVGYGEKDGDIYNGSGSECYMSLREANEAFKIRLASANPDKPSRDYGGIYNIVDEALRLYADKNIYPHEKPAADWDGFSKQVLDTMFGLNTDEYDASGIRELLSGLTTTIPRYTEGRSHQRIDLPAWKVLEMVTAITAFGMIIRQREEQRLRKAA